MDTYQQINGARPAPPPRFTAGPALAAWQINRVEAIVALHMGRTMTVPEMAAAAGLGRCQFARAVKASLGCSPHAWLMRRRVEHARWLMLHTRESLAEIALLCGLSDQSHLTRLFRRVTGQTPGRWRREARGWPPAA